MSIGTFFGESGAEMIAEVLKNKSMLTKLKLRCNEMDKKMGKKNSLQKGTEWTDCKIREQEMRIISESMMCNSSLTELNMFGEEMNKECDD